MQSHRQQQASVITPDTSTVPTQETPRYTPQEPQTNKNQQDLKLVTEVHTTELVDPQQIMLEEVDTISMLYDGLQEETVVNVEETKSVTPAETPNRNTNTLGYASSGPEDEGFQFHQNRSTAVFNQRRNTFMSSDDERGDPSSRRKTAANKQMHVSSLMGETKQNDKLKNRKSVKEIGFRRGQKQDDSQLDAMSQGQGSDTTPKAQMSVADRLKSSLASFKNNKLSMDKDKNKSVLSRASNENKSMAQKRATTPVQDRKPVK